MTGEKLIHKAGTGSPTVRARGQSMADAPSRSAARDIGSSGLRAHQRARLCRDVLGGGTLTAVSVRRNCTCIACRSPTTGNVLGGLHRASIDDSDGSRKACGVPRKVLARMREPLVGERALQLVGSLRGPAPFDWAPGNRCLASIVPSRKAFDGAVRSTKSHVCAVRGARSQGAPCVVAVSMSLSTRVANQGNGESKPGFRQTPVRDESGRPVVPPMPGHQSRTQ